MYGDKDAGNAPSMLNDSQVTFHPSSKLLYCCFCKLADAAERDETLLQGKRDRLMACGPSPADALTHAETVFVVDDDQNIRDSIEWTLRHAGHNVELFSKAPDCLDALDSTHPLCVVVDLLLPGMTGLKLCEQLRSRSYCAFVIISGNGEVSSAVQAMKLGAVDFLEKPFDRQRLLDAVYEAIEVAKSRRTQLADEAEIAAKLESLSSREREIFDCLAGGLITKQIAQRLGISPRTVDVHRSNISQKLCLESPTQLGHVIYQFHCLRERKKGS
ncbi:MAG: response regulator [Pirellulaceae bacterium]|jgi:FixJ family two-component response regulator|nr:response regulator [Pirellulaceae bacterium]